MDHDIAGLLDRFKLIQRHGRVLLEVSIKTYPPRDITREAQELFDLYNAAKNMFDLLKKEHNFNIEIGYIHYSDIKIVGMPFDDLYIPLTRLKAKIRQLDIECGTAIGILESLALPISEKDVKELEALRDELKKLAEELPDVNYERNLTEAINEYEKGDYLASALIAGRVIIYVLAQIPGKNDEEKVKCLSDKGIVEKDRRDVRGSIIKAGKVARNFTSHNIKIFPEPSEALSLLGDAITILKVISKLSKT